MSQVAPATLAHFLPIAFIQEENLRESVSDQGSPFTVLGFELLNGDKHDAKALLEAYLQAKQRT